MKKKLTKTQSSRIHFKNRVKERYNIIINRKNIASLVKDIINGDNIFECMPQTNRVCIYDMMFMKKRMLVVFDKKRKVPITALTRDMKL